MFHWLGLHVGTLTHESSDTIDDTDGADDDVTVDETKIVDITFDDMLFEDSVVETMRSWNVHDVRDKWSRRIVRDRPEE